MGARASKDRNDDSDDDDNCHCFLFPAPVSRQKSGSLGTPLPQRYKATLPPTVPPPTRGVVRGRESSRYGGLEVSDRMSISGHVNGNGSLLPAAEIHEGEVRV